MSSTTRRRAGADPRVLERHLRSQLLPRFIERLREIEDELAVHRLRLARAHARLERSCGGDAGLFARRWRERAEAWSFDLVNELIRQHNEYYPVERNLPLDPRTRDYVLIGGHSYRREPVGPEWVLEHFPATSSAPEE